MGLMTRDEFRAELQFELGNRSDMNTATAIEAARMDRRINTIYSMISLPRIAQHRELEVSIQIPLVDSIFAYDLSTAAAYVDSNLLGIRSARYSGATTDAFTGNSRRRMEPKSIGYFNNKVHSSNGPPIEYSAFRNNLFISPVPTASEAGNLVVLECWEEPEPLTVGGTATVIPALWDEAIVLGGKWLFQVSYNKIEATRTFASFTSYVTSLAGRIEMGTEDEESNFPDMNTGMPAMAESGV